MGSNSFTYNCNGNMSSRTVSGTTYNFSYDGENHLLTVWGGATAAFVYDGDGNRVKATIGSTTTVYIGNYPSPLLRAGFEWTGSTSTLIKYFYAGTQRVAMKQGSTVDYSGITWAARPSLPAVPERSWASCVISGGRPARTPLLHKYSLISL